MVTEAKGAKIGMPTFPGIKGALIDYAIGAGGGLFYMLSRAILGSGLIGGLLGAGIAGAAVKGTRGEIIATILGFMAIIGSMGSAQASNGAPTRGVI